MARRAITTQDLRHIRLTRNPAVAARTMNGPVSRYSHVATEGDAKYLRHQPLNTRDAVRRGKPRPGCRVSPDRTPGNLLIGASSARRHSMNASRMDQDVPG